METTSKASRTIVPCPPLGPGRPQCHSYGGTFARLLLQRWSRDVAGMVLAETGQETALDPAMEQQQYRNLILGKKPLSVLRGNTLIGKWKQLEQAEVAAASNDDATTAPTTTTLQAQRHFLEAVDKEDERLKRAQLALSSHHRYVHIPDCGHDVIDQRPESVAGEVRWVMDNLHTGEDAKEVPPPPPPPPPAADKPVSWVRRKLDRLLVRF
jgi:pimeloyl-ACP methyl ester carboxylesterase